jgi:serine/threonine protein phosphatase PrpC
VIAERYAATMPQEGRRANEDAFLIGHGAVPFVALADGAGNAEQAAVRVLRQFKRLFEEADADALGRFPTWQGWVKVLDSLVLGGPQSTFVGAALLEERVVGTCVGDSRAYLRDRDGRVRVLTEGASKQRLGSGRSEPFPIHERLAPSETLILLTDGAWTPLSLNRLTQVLARHALGPLSDLPSAILEAAGRTGRADDMTAVVARRQR